MWEIIDEERGPNGGRLQWTSRARVPEGWLVRHDWAELPEDRTPSTSTMCFMPDPQHEWDRSRRKADAVRRLRRLVPGLSRAVREANEAPCGSPERAAAALRLLGIAEIVERALLETVGTTEDLELQSGFAARMHAAREQGAG